MKTYISFLIGIAISVSCFASGEIEIGRSSFSKQPDGTWYQEPFEHQLNMQTPSIAIGVTGYASDSWRYHIGYRYLGSVSSYALAVASDAVYARYGANAAQHLAMGKWYGSGSVQMIYGTIAPEWNFGTFTYAVEFGLSVYRPTWTEQVIDFWNVGDKKPMSLTLKHNPRLEIGKSIGVSVKRGDVSVVLTAYPNINAAGDEYPAIYKGIVWNLALRYGF